MIFKSSSGHCSANRARSFLAKPLRNNPPSIETYHWYLFEAYYSLLFRFVFCMPLMSHQWFRMTWFACSAPSSWMRHNAQEGETEMWASELCTVSEVEWTTEGDGVKEAVSQLLPTEYLYFFVNSKNNAVFFFSRFTHLPWLFFLSQPLSSSLSLSLSLSLFLLTERELKSASPVLSKLELCVQAEYRV